MRTVAPLVALVAALILGPSAHAAAPSGPPVVVELYTSQGCSACSKAGDLTSDLARRAGVLPLTFSVDYWDYLGWTDTFARPEFADRQRAFMRKLALRDVYTPQVIVDGRAQAAAGQTRRVDVLIREAAKTRPPRGRIAFYAGQFVRAEAGAAPSGGADIWLIRYLPLPEPVEVKEGENRGQTVAYVNVVRELTRLGGWTGRRKTYPIPPAEDPALKTVILLQAAKGGRILGVLER